MIHEQGLVSVLKQIHDDLDAAVFDAYGWPHDLTDEQILERLVALNAERAEEERRGLVRWLRPDFQNPSGKRAATQVELAGTEEEDEADEAAPSAKAWPKKLPEQIAAVRDVVTRASGGFSAKEVAKAFKGGEGQRGGAGAGCAGGAGDRGGVRGEGGAEVEGGARGRCGGGGVSAVSANAAVRLHRGEGPSDLSGGSLPVEPLVHRARPPIIRACRLVL